MILSTQQLNKKMTFYFTIFLFTILFIWLIKYKKKKKIPAGFQ